MHTCTLTHTPHTHTHTLTHTHTHTHHTHTHTLTHTHAHTHAHAHTTHRSSAERSKQPQTRGNSRCTRTESTVLGREVHVEWSVRVHFQRAAVVSRSCFRWYLGTDGTGRSSRRRDAGRKQPRVLCPGYLSALGYRRLIVPPAYMCRTCSREPAASHYSVKVVIPRDGVSHAFSVSANPIAHIALMWYCGPRFVRTCPCAYQPQPPP
jgi:hypothetical protein